MDFTQISPRRADQQTWGLRTPIPNFELEERSCRLCTCLGYRRRATWAISSSMRSEQHQQDETSDLKTKAKDQSLTRVSQVLLWENSQFAACHDELTQDEPDPTPAAKTEEAESHNAKRLHPGGAIGGRRHRGHSLRGSPSELLISDR